MRNILFATLVAVAIVGYPMAYLSTERDTTITVTDKERINTREDSYYLVFAEEGEFKVDDSLLYFDWRASSRYNALKVDSKCNVTMVGWRLGILSMYPNIVNVGVCLPNE